MIALAQRPPETGHEVSVAEATVTVRNEVKSMSVTTIDRRFDRRARPGGLDRIVMRLSLAMLLWARRHADRTALSHDEQARRRRVQLEIERRDHAMLPLIRVF